MEPTDQEIEHGIRDRLVADPRLNPANPSVHVAGGRVRLSGHALSEEERRWAAEVVRSVSGVTEVLDEIVVLWGWAPPR